MLYFQETFFDYQSLLSSNSSNQLCSAVRDCQNQTSLMCVRLVSFCKFWIYWMSVNPIFTPIQWIQNLQHDTCVSVLDRVRKTKVRSYKNFDETKSPSKTCQVKILVHGLHTDTFVLIYTCIISPDRFMSDTVILNFSFTCMYWF